MKYRKVGKTDIEVSLVAMGCWAIVGGSVWGHQDKNDAVQAIETSIDVGVTLFDTAEGYGGGSSEEMLGEILKPHRQNVAIATKCGADHMQRDDVIDACERSLSRLQTDYIDIYMLHWPSRDVPFDETAEALQTLIDHGKIRAAGVSNFGPRDLPDFLGVCRAEVNQIAYNLLFRAPEYELMPICMENDVSVLCYSPLAEALLTGKFASADDVPVSRARMRHFSKDRELSRHNEDGAEKETFGAVDLVREIARDLGLPMAQVALAWLLEQDSVTSVIAGARNAMQARENAAVADVELPDAIIKKLAETTEPLKEKLGQNLDMWQSESRIR